MRGTGALGILLLAACAGREVDRADVTAGLETRIGQGIGPGGKAGDLSIPPGVRVDDGLSETEAVAVALWNNAAFQEALAELGIARADLVQAGLLSNPVLSVLFPLGPRQLEFAAKLPLEVLWLRPKRIAAAELEGERVAQKLVQGGLDLARDVRAASAELRRAREEAFLRARLAGLREEAENLEAARLRAGDASELEVDAARVRALEARVASARASAELTLALARLRGLLGFAADPRPLDFQVERRDRTVPVPDDAALRREAFAWRPDLRAAEIGVEAAGERAGLARWDLFALSAVVDGDKAEDGKGFDLTGGVEVEIPLFNRRQGARARTDAELEQALRRAVTVRHRIALEVKEASARLLLAADEQDVLRGRILPALAESLRRAERAAAAGETSRLQVIEASARLEAANVEAARADADLDRAWAELERNVGRRIE